MLLKPKPEMKIRYVQPEIEEIRLTFERNILSGDPPIGGSEDVGYEDIP